MCFNISIMAMNIHLSVQLFAGPRGHICPPRGGGGGQHAARCGL